jgi:hypothetical protein
MSVAGRCTRLARNLQEEIREGGKSWVACYVSYSEATHFA